MRRLALCLLSVAGVALFAAGSAAAATYTVNTTIDQEAPPGTTADGICDADAVGPPFLCTLRAAIQEANASAAADLIQLPNLGSPYVLDEPGANEDAAVVGDLDVRESLTLTGTGRPVIDADGLDRVLHVGPSPASPAFTISGVEVRGGGGVARGAGILVDGGAITMSSTTVTASGATNPVGLAEGGGIWIDAGTSNSITASTIAGNAAAGLTGAAGGGVGGAPGAALSVTNSTISANDATGGSAEGGGIWNAGTTTLTHVTMSGNGLQGPSAPGGLIFSDAGLVYLRGTILNNGVGESGAENCGADAGGFVSLGYNLEANLGSAQRQCGTPGAGDLFAADALIAGLGDRGGPTQTHAPLNGSPALDAIPSCFPTTADQRGEPRPGAFACDIGSYERQVIASARSRCFGKTPTIVGFAKGEKIVGTPGNDVIVAEAGNDKVKGGDGNDRICGGKGKDRLRGGPGRDRIAGDDGKDALYGQAGRDRLEGGSGADLLDGGRDADLLIGGKKKDNCRGGPTDRTRDC